MALQPLEPVWLFRTAFRVTGEHDSHKLPRAAFGVCVQNIQPSKLIKHAKKGEEVRSRNESILAGNKTSYPDIPPRLAKCPGPEGPDRTRSPPGREESLQTLPPGSAGGRLASGESWGCGRLAPEVSPSRQEPAVPCHLACSRPAVPASTAPGQARSWCSSSLWLCSVQSRPPLHGNKQPMATVLTHLLAEAGAWRSHPLVGFHGQGLKAETDVPHPKAWTACQRVTATQSCTDTFQGCLPLEDESFHLRPPQVLKENASGQ